MHAERAEYESSEAPGQDDGASGQRIIPQPRSSHGIMDCLMPATPPEPKNARVIRLFDYEEKHEARPREESAKPAREESRSREAAKAARNQSLLAAAGLV